MLHDIIKVIITQIKKIFCVTSLKHYEFYEREQLKLKLQVMIIGDPYLTEMYFLHVMLYSLSLNYTITLHRLHLESFLKIVVF